MASSAAHVGPHAFFDELRLAVQNAHVVGRILRVWEVRNVNNYEDFAGISIIMLDEKNSTIHCFIPVQLAEDFFGDLSEGNLFQIGGFDLLPCTRLFKITDHPFVITLNHRTTFLQVQNSRLRIGREKFRVKSYDHLFGVANTHIALPDVVGRIISVEGPNLHDPTSTEDITVQLMLLP